MVLDWASLIGLLKNIFQAWVVTFIVGESSYGILGLYVLVSSRSCRFCMGIGVSPILTI